MAVMNPFPFFLWGGLSLIAMNHLGMDAAGVTLILGGLITVLVSTE